MRVAILTALVLALTSGCGDDNKQSRDGGLIDAGVDSGGGPDASCFTNPTTNYQIINACTDAQKIYKVSHPALLGSDGTLPPLP